MKKTLIIALAGMMLFAFTRCGESTKGTKQFIEAKEYYNGLEKIIKDASTCEELQDVAIGLLIGRVENAVGGKQYTEDEKMTEKESEQLIQFAEKLLEEAYNKGKNMGCDFDDE